MRDGAWLPLTTGWFVSNFSGTKHQVMGIPVLGFPAVSVPAGVASGLPTGAQLLERHVDKETLLEAATVIPTTRAHHKDNYVFRITVAASTAIFSGISAEPRAAGGTIPNSSNPMVRNCPPVSLTGARSRVAVAQPWVRR